MGAGPDHRDRTPELVATDAPREPATPGTSRKTPLRLALELPQGGMFRTMTHRNIHPRGPSRLRDTCTTQNFALGLTGAVTQANNP